MDVAVQSKVIQTLFVSIIDCFQFRHNIDLILVLCDNFETIQSKAKSNWQLIFLFRIALNHVWG